MTTMFMRTITNATNITTVINLSLNILQAVELSTSYIQENIDIKGWIMYTIYDGSTKETQPYTMVQQKECNYEQWFNSRQHNHIQNTRIDLSKAPRLILIVITYIPKYSLSGRHNHVRWFNSGHSNHIRSMRIDLYNTPRSILIAITHIPKCPHE